MVIGLPVDGLYMTLLATISFSAFVTYYLCRFVHSKSKLLRTICSLIIFAVSVVTIFTIIQSVF
jgi:hypothetical protein